MKSLGWFVCVVIAILLNFTNGSDDDDMVDPMELWKKQYSGEVTPSPPPKDEAAKMARYIVHYTNWCSVSHISLQNGTRGYPQARVFSTSDGPLGNSSGTPYIYVPMIDEGARDLVHLQRASMTMSLAENSYCENQNLDPQDPRCPQVVLTGLALVVKEGSEEYTFAKNALFTRHPIMKTWPKGHNWLVVKLDIKNILLVDYFGGNKYPTVEEYYAVSPDENAVQNYFTRPLDIKVNILF